MRILVTGFEPFGGSDTNITQNILSILPTQIDNMEIVTTCLPVSFLQAPLVLRQTIHQYQPDIVMNLGQCNVGDNVRLERFAMNMMDCQKPDNDGYMPSEEIIYPQAELAYKTPIALKEIQSQCEAKQLPVVVSNSAGLYVCNRVYYEALYNQHNALFVHIPKNMDVTLAAHIVLQIITEGL